MNIVKYLLVLLILPNALFAQIEISEIMYDLEGSDAKREWIEVVNTGSVLVDIGEWKFFEADTNHKLNLIKGDSNLGVGGYAVIADNADTFLSDWPNFSGVLFDSSFSLKNTGEFIALRNSELVDIDSVTYSSEWGASGDGNSLQLVGGKWVVGSPTPGGTNMGSSVPSTPDESVEEGQTVQTTSTGSSFSTKPQITAHAGENRVVIVGADTEFRGEALGLKGEPLTGARLLWNMGNGELKEGQAILHSYHYPGEYVVVLTVSSGEFSASDRLIVTATEAQVSISKVSSDLIELRNGSDVELNLSWWILKAGKESFTIPKDTLILPGKALIFSNEVTKLTVVNPESVALLYPNGVEAYHYGSNTINIEQVPTISIGIVESPKPNTEVIDATKRDETVAVKTSVKGEISAEAEQVLDAEQVASPLSAIGQRGEDTNSSVYKWLLALVTIISIAVIGVLLRKRKEIGDEIEILD